MSSARDFASLTQAAHTTSFNLNRDLDGGNDACAKRITVPGRAIRDFCDLSGLILGMDMIVTTCPAQAHLAGTWHAYNPVTRSQHDVRWETGDCSALYPGLQIVMATRVGQWDGAIDRTQTLISTARMASKR